MAQRCPSGQIVTMRRLGGQALNQPFRSSLNISALGNRRRLRGERPGPR